MHMYDQRNLFSVCVESLCLSWRRSGVAVAGLLLPVILPRKTVGLNKEDNVNEKHGCCQETEHLEEKRMDRRKKNIMCEFTAEILKWERRK